MAEICNRYGISPTYLYRLRDRALEAVKVALAGADKRDLSRERQLELELSRAKQLLGDQALVIEVLKKTHDARNRETLAWPGPQLWPLEPGTGTAQVDTGGQRCRETHAAPYQEGISGR